MNGDLEDTLDGQEQHSKWNRLINNSEKTNRVISYIFILTSRFSLLKLTGVITLDRSPTVREPKQEKLLSSLLNTTSGTRFAK